MVLRVVYMMRNHKPCGRCSACHSKGEKERKFSFVWNVCGDLLLTVKVRNGQQGCGRAPLAVDATRLRSRLRPRRRNKGPASPADADDDGAAEWPLLDAGEP